MGIQGSTEGPSPDMHVWARTFREFKDGVRAMETEVFKSETLCTAGELDRGDIDEDTIANDLASRAFAGQQPCRVILHNRSVYCAFDANPNNWYGWTSVTNKEGKQIRWVFWACGVTWNPDGSIQVSEHGWMLTTLKLAKMSIV